MITANAEEVVTRLRASLPDVVAPKIEWNGDWARTLTGAALITMYEQQMLSDFVRSAMVGGL